MIWKKVPTYISVMSPNRKDSMILRKRGSFHRFIWSVRIALYKPWTSRYESWYLKFIFYHLDRQQYHQATPSCPIMSLWPWKSADMNFDQLAGPEPSKLVGQHDPTFPLICMDKMMLSQHNYKTTIKAKIKRYNYHLATLPLHLYSCLQCGAAEW